MLSKIIGIPACESGQRSILVQTVVQASLQALHFFKDAEVFLYANSQLRCLSEKSFPQIICLPTHLMDQSSDTDKGRIPVSSFLRF